MSPTQLMTSPTEIPPDTSLEGFSCPYFLKETIFMYLVAACYIAGAIKIACL